MGKKRNPENPTIFLVELGRVGKKPKQNPRRELGESHVRHIESLEKQECGGS